jgi:hypothetical protein
LITIYDGKNYVGNPPIQRQKSSNREPNPPTKLPWHTDGRTECPNHQSMAMQGEPKLGFEPEGRDGSRAEVRRDRRGHVRTSPLRPHSAIMAGPSASPKDVSWTAISVSKAARSLPNQPTPRSREERIPEQLTSLKSFHFHGWVGAGMAPCHL